MSHVSFRVEADAISKGRPRVTSRGTFTPKRTREFEKLVKAAAAAVRPLDWKIDGRYRVEIGITPKTRRRSDIDNQAKAILDALNGVFYRDDYQVDQLVIERHPPDGDPPFILIDVEAL